MEMLLSNECCRRSSSVQVKLKMLLSNECSRSCRRRRSVQVKLKMLLSMGVVVVVVEEVVCKSN